jgi:hypothetical protein
MAVYVAQHRRDVACLGDDFDVVLAGEEQPEAASDEGMVVRDNNADRLVRRDQVGVRCGR